LSAIAVGIYSEQIVGPSYVVTQRLYVHRILKSLIIVEVDLDRSDTNEPVEIQLDVNDWHTSYDFTFITVDTDRELVRFVYILWALSELLFFAHSSHSLMSLFSCMRVNSKHC